MTEKYICNHAFHVFCPCKYSYNCFHMYPHEKRESCNSGILCITNNPIMNFTFKTKCIKYDKKRIKIKNKKIRA